MGAVVPAAVWAAIGLVCGAASCASGSDGVVTATANAAFDRFEPNDHEGQSGVLGPARSVRAVLSPGGDDDWYAWSVDGDDRARIAVTLQAAGDPLAGLCAYFDCRSGATPAIQCESGDPSTTGDGCCTTRPVATYRLELSAQCPTAGDAATLRAYVWSRRPHHDAVPYALSWDDAGWRRVSSATDAP